MLPPGASVSEHSIDHGPAGCGQALADGHGVQGLVNLYGIESPGMTASLAIAERVADMLS